MNQIQSFVFFDETSNSSTSNEMKNIGRGEEIELQISAISGGTYELLIEGKTDVVNGDWFPVAAISKRDYIVCEKITDDGGYSVVISGINMIRITNNGTPGGVRVFGIIVG